MNFKGNFKQLGKLDISDLKQRILQFTEEDWNRHDGRQKKFIVHKYTTTIPLIYDKDNRMQDNTRFPEYYELEALIKPIYSLIDKYYKKSLKYKRLIKRHGNPFPVRTIIARLQPGGEIAAHMDRNHLLSHCHRIHIPIATEENINFGVGDEDMNLKEGEVWEINNRKEHHVENKSDIYRIHMIVDWEFPRERCCCGTKINPQGSCSPVNCHDTDFRRVPCDCLN